MDSACLPPPRMSSRAAPEDVLWAGDTNTPTEWLPVWVWVWVGEPRPGRLPKFSPKTHPYHWKWVSASSGTSQCPHKGAAEGHPVGAETWSGQGLERSWGVVREDLPEAEAKPSGSRCPLYPRSGSQPAGWGSTLGMFPHCRPSSADPCPPGASPCWGTGLVRRPELWL